MSVKDKNRGIVILGDDYATVKCSCGNFVRLLKIEDDYKSVCSGCSNVLIYVSKDKKIFEFPSVEVKNELKQVIAMTNQEKREKVKSLVEEMLNESHDAVMKKIDKALDCGAIDISDWSATNAPMMLPKCIVVALLEEEARQYDCRGTSYQRKVKKLVSSIRLYL